MAEAQKEVETMDIPEGYYLVWSGMLNEMKQAFRRFYVIIPLAIFMIRTLLFIVLLCKNLVAATPHYVL